MLAIVLVATGCAPTLPFAATETADVLAARQVAVTVSGGGGVGGLPPDNGFGYGGGGSARVRVGVGHDQEVGVETGVGAFGSAVVVSGKLRYKLGLNRHLALVAGLGLSGAFYGPSSDGPYGGVDVALLASSDTLAKRLQVYGGLRLSVSLPLLPDFYAHERTEQATLPLGLAIRTSRRTQLFFEAGLMTGLAQQGTPATGENQVWLAGYLAAALQFTAGKM